ncbi:hypothetical protein DERP_007829 [Dermatophagoides pteronyssinus]|uniref:Uncharacterized protein n=1 Tax=Dermatophagoides pteronyssinus TaxID=6956 RepID=A0ABQ8ISU9_DERPT|nr:hypothetical protein DERP_007829 [Dermatophagoides pteronyssinus]
MLYLLNLLPEQLISFKQYRDNNDTNMNEINFKYRYGARGKNLGQNFFKIFNITSSTSFEKFGCQRL